MKQFKRIIEMPEHITITAGTPLMRSPPGRISLTSFAGRRLVREAFQMKRNRAYRRWQRNRAINRKVRILKRIGGDGQVFAWSRGDTGRFAKGKIHCSCRMCRTKSYDYLSHVDERRILAASQRQAGQE
jgi:hypothetical protein